MRRRIRAMPPLPTEPVSPMSPAHSSVPTPREREVLALIAEGLTDREIAARLVVSPETVHNHVKGARWRLGATTRAQAVAIAMRRGLVGAGT